MTRLVYSTGPEGPDEPEREESPRLAPGEHSIVVRRERRGRRGKTVTLAGPFLLPEAEAAGLLKRLKRLCGCGGTLKREDGPSQTLEIQGDQVARVAEHLASLGYRVRSAGQ